MWNEMTFKIKSTIIELERIITTMKAYANAAKTIATIGVLGDNGLMSKITGRANGGVVGLGETTLVGENGPEIARFPAGTRITPNSQVGNSPMTINITGTFLSEDSAEQVGDLIIDKLKLQGAI